jgi:hypothetical protein
MFDAIRNMKLESFSLRGHIDTAAVLEFLDAQQEWKTSLVDLKLGVLGERSPLKYWRTLSGYKKLKSLNVFAAGQQDFDDILSAISSLNLKMLQLNAWLTNLTENSVDEFKKMTKLERLGLNIQFFMSAEQQVAALSDWIATAPKLRAFVISDLSLLYLTKKKVNVMERDRSMVDRMLLFKSISQ